MKRSLSSRQGLLLVSQGVALACLVGGAVRCSSSSGGNVVADDAGGSSSSGGTSGGSSGTSGGSSGTSGGSSGTSGGSSGTSGGSSGTSGGSSGGTSSGGIGDGGFSVEASADGGCSSQDPATLATKVTFKAFWPSTAVSYASDTAGDEVDILLLTTFTGTSALTGTSRSCGLVLPPLVLNAIGGAAAGGADKTKVQIQVLNTTWDKITRTFPVTGTQSGFNIGDTLDTSPSIGLLGLTNASGYNVNTKAWPPTCTTGCTPAGSFMMAQLQDDDNDTKPAITANPSQASGYALPPTANILSQVADEVYIVSRNEIALNGMHAVDCYHGTGTAKITLFDNHVVGCHVTSLHGTAGACSTDQVSFLDTNRTIYGYDTTAGHVASPSNPIMGTVSTVQVPADATCAMARAAFSPTFN